MEGISGSINNLIIKTYGGLLVFWSAIGYVSVKLLVFLGGCMAEGAINKGIVKIIPIVKAEFRTEFDSLKKEISDIKRGLRSYKDEKHRLEGENSYLRDAIVSEDKEIFEEVKKILKRQENEKK